MEYCDKSLDKLAPLSLTQIKQLIIDIARALKTIHTQEIVHLDIKPGKLKKLIKIKNRRKKKKVKKRKF